MISKANFKAHGRDFLVVSLLGISMISVLLLSAPARAADFIEGFAASALVSTGFDVTSDGSNEAKRAELNLLHDDAAEVVLGEVTLPSPSLQAVFTEMKKEIKAKQPNYDLTQLNNIDLARAVLRQSVPKDSN